MERTARLYLLNTDGLGSRADQYLPLLTSARRAEVERCRDEGDRLRRIAAGLLLREVLGVREDGDLVFNEYGKPFLAAGGFQFSLSHAGQYAALAVAEFPIGVDIEPVKIPYPQILRRYFTPEELDWLDREPNQERFYMLWTRLESALKAHGTGFALRERAFSLLDTTPWFFREIIQDRHMIVCATEVEIELCIDTIYTTTF